MSKLAGQTIVLENEMSFLREFLPETQSLEVCVTERLTPRTPNLEVQHSSLAHRVVSSDKEPYSTLQGF